MALEKTQIRHDLPLLLSQILCSSLLFIDDLFSVCFQGRICISFLHCSSLDIRLFTYVISCSLFAFLSPYSVFFFFLFFLFLVSSLTFLTIFPQSLYVFYFFLLFWSLSLFLFILFLLKTLSPQTWTITIPSRCQSTKNILLFGYCCLESWLDIAKYR